MPHPFKLLNNATASLTGILVSLIHCVMLRWIYLVANLGQLLCKYLKNFIVFRDLLLLLSIGVAHSLILLLA